MIFSDILPKETLHEHEKVCLFEMGYAYFCLIPTTCQSNFIFKPKLKLHLMKSNYLICLLASGTLLFSISCKKSSTQPSNTPPPPSPGVNYLHAIKVTETGTSTIAILADHSVIWGNTGAWTTTNLSGIVDVTPNFTALKNDGTVWMMDTSGLTYNWSMISGLSNITAISGMPGTSNKTNLVLKSDGTVWAWGQNRFGEIGDSSYITRHTPVQVKHLSGITAIICGSAHCLALKNDGTLWGWGQNLWGELGAGAVINTPYNYPIQVGGYSGIASIAAGNGTTLVLKNDGTVWASGVNSTGALGNGTTTSGGVPTQVTGLTGVKAIVGGHAFSMAVKNDSTVWAWGSNASGSLGNGTTIAQSLTPVQVSYLAGVTSVSLSTFLYGGFAIEKDGVVWFWGNNSNNLPDRMVK